MCRRRGSTSAAARPNRRSARPGGPPWPSGSATSSTAPPKRTVAEDHAGSVGKAGSCRRTSSPGVMAELGLHGRKPPRRRRSLTTCSGAGAGGRPRSALGGELFAHPLTDTLGHGQLITFGPHLRQLLGQLFFERVPFPAPCGDPSSSSGSVYRIVEGHPATESRNRRPPLIIKGSSGASPRRPAPTLTSKKPSPKGGRRLAPPAGLEPAAKRLEGAWCID